MIYTQRFWKQFDITSNPRERFFLFLGFIVIPWSLLMAWNQPIAMGFIFIIIGTREYANYKRRKLTKGDI